MRKFFQQKGLWVLIASLIVTGVLMLGSTMVSGFTSPIENAVGMIATPFQRSANVFLNWVEGMYDYAFRYDQMQERVLQLEAEVAEMRAQNREAQDALDENVRLRELLNLAQKRNDMTFEDAIITGRSSSNYESTLTLNKGEKNGIRVNQCVITETGYLVGVVAEVGTNYCVVTTLIDPGINVGAVVYRTDSGALLASDLTTMIEGKCKLTYLTSDAQLLSGDEVLTSGETGIYPSGIVIGSVEEVRTAISGIERYAIIQPSVDLDSLTEVFIIKDFSID